MPPIPMTASMRLAEKNGFTNVAELLETLPPIGDQSAETITENTIKINSQCEDPRLKFILQRLVHHLHDFAREVNLNTSEWMTAIQFLTETGKICSPVRQEFILLSDCLGLSVLVDSQSHPKPEGATEATVLGPFHTSDAVDVKEGGSIASEGKGQPLAVSGVVTDVHGKAIPGAKIDTWETDENGFYDVQYEDRSGPDCRGIVYTDSSGKYDFNCVVPVPYPIPTDGPVGKLLLKTHRHCFRPAHLHFKIEAPGYETLVTALYRKGDPFITSDAVFGVKNSLIVDMEETSPGQHTLKHDFVLVTEEEAGKLRERLAKERAVKYEKELGPVRL